MYRCVRDNYEIFRPERKKMMRQQRYLIKPVSPPSVKPLNFKAAMRRAIRGT